MAGLNHSFFLVRTAEFSPTKYSHFTALPGEIELHDDFLRYLGDSLRWIPAHNPARNEPCMGLCMYGPTVLHAEGARVAAAIFSAWARLFALGPRELDLTGDYGWIHEAPSTGAYARLRLDREALCSRLNGLAGWAEQVAAGEGRLYLLHCGI